jgi:hypothetical protein
MDMQPTAHAAQQQPRSARKKGRGGRTPRAEQLAPLGSPSGSAAASPPPAGSEDRQRTETARHHSPSPVRDPPPRAHPISNTSPGKGPAQGAIEDDPLGLKLIQTSLSE